MKKKTAKISVCALTMLTSFGMMSITASASNFKTTQMAGYDSTLMMYSAQVENTQDKTAGVDEKLEAIKDASAKQEVMGAFLNAFEDLAVQEENEIVSDDVFAQSGSQNLVVANVKNYINVRSLPSENGEIVGKLPGNGVGVMLGITDGWYEIQSGSVHGYIRADLCYTGNEAEKVKKQVGTRMARVTADGLYVRKQPAQDSSILGMVANSDELIVLAQGEGWIMIDTEFGEGWACADYLYLYTEYTYAESIEEEKIRLEKEKEERKKALAAAQARNNDEVVAQARSYSSFVIDPSTVSVVGDSQLGVQVAEFAMQYVGNPYVYGGTSLTDGADCSGFVMSVYSNFGVDLPHSSAADRKQGSQVSSLEEAQAGDIICYSGHVAIYIGNGNIVHAANEKSGIVVSPADYKKILAIRRIF